MDRIIESHITGTTQNPKLKHFLHDYFTACSYQAIAPFATLEAISALQSIAKKDKIVALLTYRSINKITMSIV